MNLFHPHVHRVPFSELTVSLVFNVNLLFVDDLHSIGHEQFLVSIRFILVV